jgi:uncharacterized protein (DUF983 family)
VSLSTGTLLRRGVHRRCPVCGQKKLFRKWVQMIERCPRCSFRFQREPGEWLGSWFINLCLAQILVIGVMIGLVVASYPRTPVVAMLVAGLLATVVFPVWFFPYSRTIWVAISLAMRPLSLDEDVDPQFELEEDRRRYLDERDRHSA